MIIKRVGYFSEGDDPIDDETYARILEGGRTVGKVAVPLGLATVAAGYSDKILPKVSKNSKEFFKVYGEDPYLRGMIKDAKKSGAALALIGAGTYGLSKAEENRLKRKKKEKR